MSEAQGFCQYLPSSRRGRQRKIPSKPKSLVQEVSSFLIATPTLNTGAPKKRRRSRQTQTQSSQNSQKYSSVKPKVNANDYNIFHIDSVIRDRLSSNITSVEELQQDLVKILWILQNGDPAQQVIAKQRASMLRRRIQDLESTLELALYIFRTADLLEEYRGLIKNAGEKSFVNVGPAKYDENAVRMSELVTEYLCIAQDYVEIENMSQRPKKMVCPACQNIDFLLSVEDDSIYICKNCATEVEILDDAPSFKDTDRVNMASKYTYTRKGHFIDAVKRFQGIQNTDPKKIQDAVVVVKQQMVVHNLIGEQGKRNSVSKDHVYMFLSEQDLSKHYDDLNLLFHIITGQDCPDISDFADVLYEDFDALEEVLEEIKDDERINSLSVNYKLYKLLQRRGYSCRKDDFYILKTKTKEDEHDEKMKEAWDILGWNWIPTF